MEKSSDYRITSLAQLRAIFGDPSPLVAKKLLHALDEMAVAFIRRSPFLVIGTADAEGNQDVSPKGDGPGFVLIEDEKTIVIPDRRGNKLIFTLQNILANPHVALIFVVPGTEETLRVNGTAELSAAPALLEAIRARNASAARDPGEGTRMLLPLREGLYPLAAVETGNLAGAEAYFVGQIPGGEDRRG